MKGSRPEDRLLKKVLASITKACPMEYDVCLIGSHARGDASRFSDIDLIIFFDGLLSQPPKPRFYLDGVDVTVFSVDVRYLEDANELEFYEINNPFEAVLLVGSGRMLSRAREAVRWKSLDYTATLHSIYGAVVSRLCSAISLAGLSHAEGVRDLRACLARRRLYELIFVKRLSPRAIIPYRYVAVDELERLVDELYYSRSAAELDEMLAGLDIKPLSKAVLGGSYSKVVEALDRLPRSTPNPGATKNYLLLCILVEEYVRRSIRVPQFNRVAYTLSGQGYPGGILRRLITSRWPLPV